MIPGGWEGITSVFLSKEDVSTLAGAAADISTQEVYISTLGMAMDKGRDISTGGLALGNISTLEVVGEGVSTSEQLGNRSVHSS